MPRLDVARVNFSDVRRDVVYAAVVLENAYLNVTLLPEMGRVFRIVDKVTGHDLLWRNSVAAPNGANNDLGWWLWIGGIEYTLPGQEHGFTWALEWTWSVVNESAVVASVTEPTTGLVETLTFSLDGASLRTGVALHNPAEHNRTAHFAHWTNVPFVPGPANVLPDSTELLLPTPSVSVDPRWQKNLGPATQTWSTSPLRFISSWVNGTRMGDLTTNGLSEGFFGAYSHADDVGGLRLFDKGATPGCDTWTYGFHPPPCFPQNERIAPGDCRYAEMWGGTVKHLEVLRPLVSGRSIAWEERVAPFRGIGGLSWANRYFAANVVERTAGSGGNVVVAVAPLAEISGATVSVVCRRSGKEVAEVAVGDVTPAGAVRATLHGDFQDTDLVVVRGFGGLELGSFAVGDKVSSRLPGTTVPT